MANLRDIIHTDENLKICSTYLRYHILMYVKTLTWLRDHDGIPGWDTEKNAILEAHLVHTRILIDFLSKSDGSETDVIALDYFHDLPEKFQSMQEDFLLEQKKRIGGQLVHLTTKPVPLLKSQQDWPIDRIAIKLTPFIKLFLQEVLDSRIIDGMKSQCLQALQTISTRTIYVNTHAST